LIHGLFLHPIYMAKMKSYFKKLNYDVYCFGYKSTEYSPEVLERLCFLANQIKEKSNEIYFIGHSMGGMIARRLFQEYELYLDDTAVITLGTPHNTSHVGTYLKNSYIGGILGTAGESGIISQLEEWRQPVALGCIAGVVNIGLNTILYPFHQKAGPSDGTVFVEEALLHNATDSIVVECQHTAMIYSKDVMHLCNRFIINKNFK